MEGFPLVEDVVRMFEWFDRVGYDADIAGNESKYGIKPTKLADWVKKNVPGGGGGDD